MGCASRSVRSPSASLSTVARPFSFQRLTSILAVCVVLAACGVSAPIEPMPDGAPAPVEPAPDGAPAPLDPAPSDPAPSDPAPSDPAPDGVAAQLLAQVNAARVDGQVCGARGAFAPTHPLALEARLTAAAQDHSEDMHAHQKMSHTGSDGSDPGERIARTGYVFASWGENVAAGYASVDAVMAGWLGSDGHCANLMNPGFTEFGAGESGRYWTQVFARPR